MLSTKCKEQINNDCNDNVVKNNKNTNKNNKIFI